MKKLNLFFFVVGLLIMTTPAFADTTGYDLGTIMDKYQTAATQFGLNWKVEGTRQNRRHDLVFF